MNHRVVLTLFLILVALAALTSCGPAAGEEGAPIELQASPTVPTLQEAPALDSATSAAPPTSMPAAGYPPPTWTPNADYPGAQVPALLPTVDPYPGGLVWILRPVGVQCQEGTAAGYGDLREARSTLTAAGVKVADVELVELMVTTSCGSPTSAHYRAQIAVADLQTALSLEWRQE